MSKQWTNMERITADNFITDNRTDKVYISSLLNTVSGNLDKEIRSKLKGDILKYGGSNGSLLLNTRDVWVRDYMPIQLTKDVFLSYTYKPDYLLDKPDYITNWQLHNVHPADVRDKELFSKFKVVQIPMILDGGNVIKAVVKGKPCFIMCKKVIEENNVSDDDFYDWWNCWWKENFDNTEMELVLLPWEGEKYNPIGHADGIVRYIEEDRVLLTNYEDFDNRFFPASLFIDKLEEAGFEVETLSYKKQFDYNNDKLFRMLFKHSWCYINYLQVGNSILVPSLGYKALDNEALRQIDAAFNRKKHIAEIRVIDVDMTSIVEDMNDETNSGGALNCLTWTIKI